MEKWNSRRNSEEEHQYEVKLQLQLQLQLQCAYVPSRGRAGLTISNCGGGLPLELHGDRRGD